MVKNLIKMMDIRTKIEEKYAAELEKFSQTQRKLFANMYENEHTKHVVRAFTKVFYFLPDSYCQDLSCSYVQKIFDRENIFYTLNQVMELITEADCTAHIHRQSRIVVLPCLKTCFT